MRTVDLFAGLGGFTLGATQAGARVVWCANHWPAAVEAHRENHPGVHHVCQDLHQVDWSQVPEHDLLLASPACQGHSRARGRDRAGHDATRSTAFAVLGAVDYHRPRAVLVENVPEFQTWDGYPAWKRMLMDFGYGVTQQVLDASEFGVPQRRERLFILGLRGLATQLKSPGLPPIPAERILDWGHPNWSLINRPGRSPKTLQRIATGRRQFGRRFLVAYYGSERSGRPVTAPVGTITTRDRHAVVDGDRMRMLSTDEVRQAMGFPASYRLPRAHKLALHLMGNAVCPPVARELVRQIMEVV